MRRLNPSRRPPYHSAPVSPIPEGNWDVPVVVVGGGPGGEDCARDLADHGIKVMMVNNEPFPGGECLWRGCIPSKAWRAAADCIRNRSHDAEIGVDGTQTPSSTGRRSKSTAAGCKPAAAKWRSKPTRA